jgi:hypothetical protein
MVGTMNVFSQVGVPFSANINKNFPIFWLDFCEFFCVENKLKGMVIMDSQVGHFWR